MRKKVVEWYIPDPQGKPIEEIRNVRDEIEGMVEGLAKVLPSNVFREN
jgi:protein-tyrosine-phosphatase